MVFFLNLFIINNLSIVFIINNKILLEIEKRKQIWQTNSYLGKV
jgi:hypothetical protein